MLTFNVSPKSGDVSRHQNPNPYSLLLFYTAGMREKECSNRNREQSHMVFGMFRGTRLSRQAIMDCKSFNSIE